MDETTPKSDTWPMRWVIAGVVLVGFAGCGLVGYVAGFLHGWHDVHMKWYREQADALASIIADDPAFARVTIDRFSGGGADMIGTVETEEDLTRLRAAFVNAIGEARAREHFNVDARSAAHGTTDPAPTGPSP